MLKVSVERLLTVVMNLEYHDIRHDCVTKLGIYLMNIPLQKATFYAPSQPFGTLTNFA
jgi:hypothetical protein